MRNVLRLFIQQRRFPVFLNQNSRICIRNSFGRGSIAIQFRASHIMAENKESSAIIEKVKNLALGGNFHSYGSYALMSRDET